MTTEQKPQFSDTSSATRLVKAERVLISLADVKSYHYYFDDGFPRHKILQDAAAALEVMREMAAALVVQKTADAAVDSFLDEVRAELIRARAKFPGDRIMGLALAEEFGELCKAMLDESAANVRKEAVQTAVMAARVALDGDSSVREWRNERGLDPMVACKPVPAEVKP